MYVLKIARRKNAMISSRGDSLLWFFISANVQETDCVTIIRILIGLDTQTVRNIQHYQVGTRERTRANGVQCVDSADCCASPCFALGALFICSSNLVLGYHLQFILKPALWLSCLHINVFLLFLDAAVNTRFSL